MKPKTKTKDPDTIDSLLESKEQTDKALAELADTLREKLQRLEAVVGRQQTTDGRWQRVTDIVERKIDKRFWTWFWAAIFVLQVLCIAYSLGRVYTNFSCV